jgi:hypothetical protein
LKLTFQGEQALDDVFGDDHAHVIDNVQCLVDQQVKKVGEEDANVRGFLSSKMGKYGSVLKFRHVVFEVLSFFFFLQDVFYIDGIMLILAAA